jgi:nitrate/nitrite transporter NarK
LVLHIERDLNLTAAQIGLWVNIHLVITAALSLPIGVMVDGWGARRVGLLGAGLMAAGGIARGFAVSYATLLGSSAIFGLGFIGLFVAIPKMLSRWFCSRELGLATGVFLTGYGAGSVAGLVIVRPLFGSDWQSCFRSLGLVGLLMVVAWFRFGREPEQALPAAEFRQPRRNALRAALGTRVTWVLTLMFFCYAAGFTAWFTFGFPFLVRFRQIPERYGGLILALTMVGYTLASTSMPAFSAVLFGYSLGSVRGARGVAFI